MNGSKIFLNGHLHTVLSHLDLWSFVHFKKKYIYMSFHLLCVTMPILSQVGDDYPLGALTKKQAGLAQDLVDLGLLFKRKAKSSRFYPTSIAVNLMFGSSNAGGTRTPQQIASGAAGTVRCFFVYFLRCKKKSTPGLWFFGTSHCAVPHCEFRTECSTLFGSFTPWGKGQVDGAVGEDG